MAIQREIRAFFAPRADSVIRLVNADPSFDPLSFTISRDITPGSSGDWGNYVKAAAQALECRYGPLQGFDGVIESTLPVAAGLSSSSALVVLAAECLLHASRIDVTVSELAEELAVAEHYVGTRGGGMDQAICVGAQRDRASLIEFDPLRLTPVPIPGDWRLIIASSLIKSEKSATRREAYNSRRLDCEEALQAVLAHLDTPRPVSSYRTLLEELTPFDVEEIVDHVLDGERLKRFRHVVTEATRVSLAVRTMHVGDLQRFGALLSESHASLRDDFEVSCSELDQLVDIAISAGAAGARLTGAGFGGCVLAVASTKHELEVQRALQQQYYEPRGISDSHDRHLFIAKPSAGATVAPIS
jgi:galactokinase